MVLAWCSPRVYLNLPCVIEVSYSTIFFLFDAQVHARLCYVGFHVFFAFLFCFILVQLLNGIRDFEVKNWGANCRPHPLRETRIRLAEVALVESLEVGGVDEGVGEGSG